MIIPVITQCASPRAPSQTLRREGSTVQGASTAILFQRLQLLNSQQMTAAVDIVITEMVVLAIGSVFLLRYYAASMVTWDVLVTVYISWVLGFAAVLFLPYDLSLAIVADERSATLEKVWEFVYWSTFILAWIVLPIQMEFHGSGHFSFGEKMYDAVYRLIIQGLIAVVAGIIYVIYMLSTSGGSLSEVVGFLMAMGNTYGVLLITLLMGNGLVAIPMHLWYLGDAEQGLRDLYFSASAVEEAFNDARYELEDCEVEVAKVVSVVNRVGPSSSLAGEIGDTVSFLHEKSTNFEFSKRSRVHAYSRAEEGKNNGSNRARTSDADVTAEEATLTMKSNLVKLHARLMTAQLKARAAERRWRMLVSECSKQQEISQSNYGEVGLQDTVGGAVDGINRSDDNRGNGGHGTAGSRSSNSSIGNMDCGEDIGTSAPHTPSLDYRWWNPTTWMVCNFSCSGDSDGWCHQPYWRSWYLLWRRRMFSHTCRVMSVLCGALSGLILWCELLMSTSLDSPIAIMMTAYGYQKRNSVMVQGIAFVVLMYMALCTFWPLFRLNLGWAYKLQGPQQSSPFSLVFNAEYLSRLQFAIGYNFLMYLNVPRASNTAFNQLMKNIELIPVFGANFAVYVPLIMILVALLTLFDGYGRIIKFLGIELADAPASHQGLSCVCCCTSGTGGAGLGDDAASSMTNLQVEERIRTGKLIVTNELKQWKAAEELALIESSRHGGGGGGGGGSTAINSSNHNRDSVAYEDREDSESGTGGRGNFSNKYTGSVGNNEIMRIGIGSNMTESLIASANMRVVSSGRRSNRLGTIGGGGGDSSSSSSSSQYRNICNDDNDYIDDNIAADAVTGTGNMLSTVELSDVDNQRRSALFGSARSRYSSNTTNPLHSSSIRNTGSNSAAGNHSPMLPVPPHPPRPTTDLFSIVDNEDEENIYGGRYADS